MPVDLIESVTELLKQEKWTRTTINEFSINTFDKYDSIIDKLIENNLTTEIESILEDFLKNSKNSITALYFMSMIYARNNYYDSSYAERLIRIFKENHKLNIVKKLCEKYLKYEYSKVVLVEYINILEKEGIEEKDIVPYWERLAKIDINDEKTMKKLAKYFEEVEDNEKALSYNKKLLFYYTRKKNPNESELLKVIEKIFELIEDDDYDLFFTVIEKLNSNLLKLRIGETLVELFELKNLWNEVIELVKLIYKSLDSKYKKNKALVDKFREKVINAYRNIYKDNSQFEVCLERSKLNMSWKDLLIAIETFEKYIPFDKNSWVLHKRAGVGYIKDIKNDFLIIDFDKKKDHRMKIDMALTSLKVLPKDHILVLQKEDPDKLKSLINNEPGEFIKLTLKSLGGKATSTEMKNFLISYKVISESQWKSLWEKAKEQLKNDRLFSKSIEKNNLYILRKRPISFEDSMFEKFRAYAELTDKIKVCREYLEEGGDTQNEVFLNMIQYFKNLTSPDLEISPNFIIAYLFLKDLKSQYPDLGIELPFTEEELFKRIKESDKFIFPIKDSYFEKRYFSEMQKYLPETKEVMAEFLTKYPSKYILNSLLSGGARELVELKAKEVINYYKEKPEVFVWFSKNFFFSEDSKEFDFNQGEIILLLVNLLDYANKALIQKIDVSSNRKLFNSIIELLFKDKNFENYILNQPDEDYVKKISLLFTRIKDMSPEYIIEFKMILSRKYGDRLHEFGFEQEKVETDTFYSTAESIRTKKEYLQKLISEEIPNTKKEMELAKEKGDLRENAEYHAARERLQNLNEEAAQLKDLLGKAIAIDSSSIDTSKVSIGTTVILKDKKTGKEKLKYTILGKWDVDLSKNIISYETAIGKALIGKKPGDPVKFEDKTKIYIIEKIEKAL